VARDRFEVADGMSHIYVALINDCIDLFLASIIVPKQAHRFFNRANKKNGFFFLSPFFDFLIFSAVIRQDLAACQRFLDGQPRFSMAPHTISAMSASVQVRAKKIEKKNFFSSR
jgi:hypothetical protein